MAQIQIEGDFLASSFSILEEQPMDMLLGMLQARWRSPGPFFVGSGSRGVQNLDQDLIFSDLPHCIWQQGFRAILFLGGSGSRISFPRAGSGS